MGRQLPASVTTAIRVQVILVLMSGLTTLLTVVREDELVRAWSARQTADLDPPSFVPVAVVLFVTFALLVAVLLVFFKGGHPAARVSLVGLAFFFLFTMFVLVRAEPPTEFVVVAVVSAVLDVALVVLLLHKDTTAYLHGAELASRRDES